MDEYIENLKQIYKKGKKSDAKLRAKSASFVHTPYYYNKDYLRDIENKILEEKSKILKLKYNIFYELSDSEDQIDQYDEIQRKIQLLKDEKNKIKLKIEYKEDRKNQKINKIKEMIDILKMNYKTVPEDKKEFYLSIQEERENLMDLLKDNISIIVNEKNKKKIFVLTNDYQPIKGNEITDTYSMNMNTPNSNNSNGNNGNGNGNNGNGNNGNNNGNNGNGNNNDNGKGSKSNNYNNEIDLNAESIE